MLKLIYTEDLIYVEQLVESLEEIVMGRVQLAIRVNQPITVIPGSISVLIPRQHPKLQILQEAVQRDKTRAISICIADEDYFEVNLTGTWVREKLTIDRGSFLVVLGEEIELILCQLWQDTTEPFIDNSTHKIPNKK